MDMDGLLRVFGITRKKPEEEEDAAGTSSAPANFSPEDYVCPMPTPAEQAAMFDALHAQRRRLKIMVHRQCTGYYRSREGIEQPEVAPTTTTFSSARHVLGKRLPRPIPLSREAGGYARRRQPTAAEEAAAHERDQALCRDRLRRKDLAPEAYRERKLDKSDALRSRLAELGASTPPSCVYVDEVYEEQAKAARKYGGFSMYADRRGRHVAEIFTDDDFDYLVLDGYEHRGRDLPVFDREGRRYGFEFIYSEEHGYYRLAGIGAEYERFMAENNVVELGKKMTMKIFAFRSPNLLPEGKGFHDHPDGALGMIILFSETEDEDEYADYIELDDDSMTVKEMVEHIQKNQKVID